MRHEPCCKPQAASRKKAVQETAKHQQQRHRTTIDSHEHNRATWALDLIERLAAKQSSVTLFFNKNLPLMQQDKAAAI